MYPRLKELREEKKYTLRDMGELLGVSYQAYSNYENGHREPSISILEKISSIYDVSIDYIVGNSDERSIHTIKQYLKFLVNNIEYFNKIVETYNLNYNNLLNDSEKKQFEEKYFNQINEYKNLINQYINVLIKIKDNNTIENGYDKQKHTFIGVQWAKHYLESENFFQNKNTAYEILTADQIIQIANQLKFNNDEEIGKDLE